MSLLEILPSVEVPAITPTPYPFGLFSVAPAATPADGHWTAGVWWQTAACNLVGVTFAPCTVEDEIPAKDVNVTCGIGSSAAAFTVYARSDQSVGGGTLDEKFGQARDLLLAGEQFAVETTLWGLLLAATPAPGAAVDIPEAVGLAEAEIASLYGGTATFHLNRLTATLAGRDSVLRVDGARLCTFLGAQAIAGGGYGDAAADPISIIATGALVIVRGEVFNLGQHIDTDTNSVSAVVERTYVVGWDCAAVRYEIT